MAETIEYKYKADTKKATKDVENLGDAMKDTQKQAGKTEKNVGEMADAVGTLGGPIKGAIDGVKSLGMSLKALMANPIVLLIAAIVGALTLLYKAFTSTKEGGEKMNQMMAFMSAGMDVLRDIAVQLTEKLISVFQDPKKALNDFVQLLKDNVYNRFVGLLELIPKLGKAMGLLFEGEFSKAGEVALDAVSKVTLGVENMTQKMTEGMEQLQEITAEMIREGKIAAEIEGKLQKLADAERKLNIERARRAKQIEANRAIADDENKSLEERRQALDKALASEENLLQNEVYIAQRRYNLIKQKNKQTSETIDGVEKEAEALQKLYELQAQLSAKQTERNMADKNLLIQIEQQKLMAVQTAFTGIVETYDNAAEKQRQLRDDESASIQSRIEANQRLRLILDEGEQKEKENIQTRIDGLKAINDQYGASVDRNNEILALTEELKGVEAKYQGQRSEQLTNINGLLKEERELQISIGETQLEVDQIIAESNLERIEGTKAGLDAEQQMIDDRYNAEKTALDNQISQLKVGTQAYQDALNERKLLDAQYTADTESLAIKRRDFEKQVIEAKYEYTKNGFTAISGLLDAFAGEDEARQKKLFKANKAISIANAVLSTYEAVNAALATKQELFPYERFIRASLALATGLANVKKITDTQFSPSGTTSPSGGGTPVVGPSVGIVGGQMNNNVQMAGLLNERKPQRAYVVGQDVDTQQSLDRHIKQNATLGE